MTEMNKFFCISGSTWSSYELVTRENDGILVDVGSIIANRNGVHVNLLFSIGLREQGKEIIECQDNRD